METEHVPDLLAATRVYFENPPLRPGPRVNKDLPDGMEILCGTGIRISELLGLRYVDMQIDEGAPNYFITLTGSVRWVKGCGTLRRPYTKNGTTGFLIPIGEELAALLRRRREAEIARNPYGAVFPSRSGGWVDPGNWRSRWRKARKDMGVMFDLPDDLDLETITPHTFRRTVATFVEGRSRLEEAQKLLDHSSMRQTKVYVRPSKVAPDHSAILRELAYGTK
ncbi:hypothetical protein GCM10009784_07860 [Arthrobacter parietis]|uniref:Tyr recombinase domain-containing protein n=1 Tax=Arthrobacter parietis TaxID=271434 RepID=A0ABP5MKB8_9MICC